MSLGAVSHLPHTTYENNNVKIDFYRDPDIGLTVAMETKNFLIRSICPQDREKYEADQSVEYWIGRWQANDPYGVLIILDKETQFLGHVSLERGHNPGEADLSYVGNENYSDKALSEVVTAMIQEYAPATVKEGYVLFEGEVLSRIIVTAYITKKVALRFVKEGDKYAIDVKLQSDQKAKLRFCTVL